MRRVGHSLLSCFLLLIFSAATFAGQPYPTSPDPTLTPGAFCDQPDSRRYPERIAYCERQVSRQQKQQVIEDYNRRLGYRISRVNRAEFKIDHLIPLCAGGSNEDENLWPQHRTVYQITDPLEGLICEKMAEGRLLQRRAVELVMRAKQHLHEAREIQAIVEAL